MNCKYVRIYANSRVGRRGYAIAILAFVDSAVCHCAMPHAACRAQNAINPQY